MKNFNVGNPYTPYADDAFLCTVASNLATTTPESSSCTFYANLE